MKRAQIFYISTTLAALTLTSHALAVGASSPNSNVKPSVKELVFTMELAGNAAPVKGKENTLEANLTGKGHWNEPVTLKTIVTLNGQSFDENGSIEYTGHGKIQFKTVGSGHIEPSTLAGVQAGVVSWKITQGDGEFTGATGYITSNFTVNAEGRVTDNHTVRIFVPQ